jgi:NCAIR mutase (PurE)-related protein
MDKDSLESVLRQLKDGKLDVRGALAKLRSLPFDNLGFARVDSHRGLRLGMPEVIFCEGKTDGQILKIFSSLAKSRSTVLATRVSSETARKIRARFARAQHNRLARTVLLKPRSKSKPMPGRIAIVTAGTADIPVAEEAAVTCDALGRTVTRLFDVGVAGIHRLTSSMDELEKHDVFIVAAGMEGALASVVGGLIGKPVIAVPTSVGYGASFGGIAALLSMLNSCSSGVTVVNIDAGFAAACAAVRILGLLGDSE